MSVALIEPFDEWFLSLSKGSGTTRRNDCYTKCGGFDKLNHRNANLLDNPRFAGVCYSDIPSLRFGTGFACPYNPCHGLLLKYSKLKINKNNPYKIS